MIIHFGNTVGDLNMRAILADRDAPGLIDQVKIRVDLYLESVEHLLGVPKGSMHRVDRAHLASFIESTR